MEKTVSTDDRDKFCAAICAFANDMPGEGRNGYPKVLGTFKVIVLSTLRGAESILTTGQSIPFAAENRPLTRESILKARESIMNDRESILIRGNLTAIRSAHWLAQGEPGKFYERANEVWGVPNVWHVPFRESLGLSRAFLETRGETCPLFSGVKQSGVDAITSTNRKENVMTYLNVWDFENGGIRDGWEMSYGEIRDYSLICTDCMTVFDFDSGYESDDDCPNCEPGTLADANDTVDVWEEIEDGGYN